MEYTVNKGAGKGVEFKGLATVYLFVLAVGLAAVLLSVILLYFIGASPWACVAYGLIAGSVFAYVVFRMNARFGVVFRMNARFGEHGLVKRLARHHRPRRLINRNRVYRMLPERRKA